VLQNRCNVFPLKDDEVEMCHDMSSHEQR
jgi:hypothetical protein